MTRQDLRDLLILCIRQNTSTLTAGEVEGEPETFYIEHDDGTCFFLEIKEA